MRITIKDVARAANVSQATVSLVLNDAPGVSLTTREHVRSVMSELNYTPDALARSFSSRRAKAVALVLPHWRGVFSDPYFTQLLSGALEAVRDCGYQMLLEIADTRFVEQKLWRQLFACKRVDGLLIATPYLDQSYLSELAESGFPAVLINGARPDLPALDYVGHDDPDAGTPAGLDRRRHLRTGRVEHRNKTEERQLVLGLVLARVRGVDLTGADREHPQRLRGELVVLCGDACADLVIDRDHGTPPSHRRAAIEELLRRALHHGGVPRERSADHRHQLALGVEGELRHPRVDRVDLVEIDAGLDRRNKDGAFGRVAGDPPPLAVCIRPDESGRRSTATPPAAPPTQQTGPRPCRRVRSRCR